MVPFRDIVCIVFILSCATALDVSFYGESYMSVSLFDRSAYTKVMLQFMSQQENGTLLAASGDTGFILMELVRGELQVSLNSGSGAGTQLLVSQQKSLNDRQWHSLTFSKQAGDLVVHVDSLTVTGFMDPQHAELSIHSVYLGGVPARDTRLHDYLTRAKHFRGCMRHVKYNRYEIFNVTNNLLDSGAMTHKTDWFCAPEFQALPSDSFSFQNSYAIFRPSRELQTNQFNVTFQLKTRSPRGVVMFASSERASGYLYLELVSYGTLRLVVKSSNRFEKIHVNLATRRYNDGRWHLVTVAISERVLALTVDGAMQNKTLNSALVLNLRSSLSFGGVSFYEDPDAIMVFPSRTGLAIEGCVQDIQVNSRLLLNFDNVHVTHGVKSKCQWPYPCTEDPCIPEAQCEELNGVDFACRCSHSDERLCRKAPGTVETDRGEYFSVSIVHLREGDQVVLTERHIRFLFDFAQHGLEAGQVLFIVRTPPRRGRLRVNVEHRREQDRFTLADLQQGRVQYVHDGSEEITDNAEIVVLLKAPLERLPPDFKYTSVDEARGFDLNFYVAPENDRPIAMFPSGTRLTVLKYDRLLISSRHFSVQDGDNRPDELRWTIRYAAGTVGGNFVRRSAIRTPLFEFSHQEVLNRAIEFHNHGAQSVRVLIRVSDGRDASEEVRVEFEAIELNVTLLVNTGLRIAVNSSVVISSENILSWTNFGSLSELQYKILSKPRYCSVLLCQASICQPVEQFSQSDLSAGHVSVHAPPGVPPTNRDDFKFNICLSNGRCVDRRYSFDIHLVPRAPQITLLVNRPLELYGAHATYKPLTKSHLKSAAETHPDLPTTNIRYVVLSTARFGQLIRLPERAPLGSGSSFSQLDIDIGSVLFNYTGPHHLPFNDSFEFGIEALQARSGPYQFVVSYQPSNSAANMRLINQGLTGVKEGGWGIINSNRLSIQAGDTVGSRYQLKVVSRPSHGGLHLVNAQGDIVQRDVSALSGQNLEDGLIQYHHDGSESAFDSFQFELSSTNMDNGAQLKPVTNRFNISIQLVNDNAPVRVGNGTLMVATKQRRLLTHDILSFKDADTNFDPHDMVFNFVDQQMDIGYFLDVSRRVKVTSFAQKQVLMKQVYFVHSPKPEYASVSVQALLFTVNDGILRARNETLIVNVTRPFVKLQSSEFLFEFSGSSILSFPLETNLDLEPRRTQLTVTAAPANGQLLFQADRRPIEKTSITYQDIIDGKIVYQHDGRSHSADGVTLDLLYHDDAISMKSTLTLRLLVADRSRTLVVDSNLPVRVLQHSSTTVDQTSLRISSSKAPPNQVVYSLAQRALHGRLEDGLGTPVHRFSQQDLSDRRIRYKHTSLTTHSTSSAVIRDHVGLTVSDGHSTIPDLQLQVAIVDLKINLIVKTNLTGYLGKRLIIEASDLQVNFDPADQVAEFELERLRFVVTTLPTKGRLITDE